MALVLHHGQPVNKTSYSRVCPVSLWNNPVDSVTEKSFDKRGQMLFPVRRRNMKTATITMQAMTPSCGCTSTWQHRSLCVDIAGRSS